MKSEMYILYIKSDKQYFWSESLYDQVFVYMHYNMPNSTNRMRDAKQNTIIISSLSDKPIVGVISSQR